MLPLLILLANLAGLLIGFGTGDARLMLAKDSAVTSLVGFALLGSVALGRPMMTATLKPWLVKGTRAGRLPGDGCGGSRRRSGGRSCGSRRCGASRSSGSAGCGS